MSVDLNFWKYRSGVYLDNAMVYEKACCDNEQVEGLENLPNNAVIHRAKPMTKVTSFMQFGNAQANRPCQCKTAQLSGKDQTRQFLGELLQKSIERVVNDFLERTYYE